MNPEKTQIRVFDGALSEDVTVACVGDTCIDISLHLGLSALGGNAVNVAVNLARQGIRSAWIGRVGPDADGRRVVEGLRSLGIGTDPIMTEDMTCRAYLATDSGGHTVVKDVEGIGSPVSIPDDRMQALSRYPIVFAKGVVGADAFVRRLRAGGVHTLYDYSTFLEEVGDTAADICFFSMGEGGDEEGRRIAVRCFARGARIVVSTLGADGCLALTSEGEEVRVAAPRIEVVDTIGAGDAFIAGFLALGVRGRGLEEALRAGVEQGSLTCGHAFGFTDIEFVREAVPGSGGSGVFSASQQQ